MMWTCPTDPERSQGAVSPAGQGLARRIRDRAELEDEGMGLTENEIGLWSDWEEVLDQAWQVGRGSRPPMRRIRFANVMPPVTELLAKPKTFFSNRSFDPTAVRSAVLKFAGSLYVELALMPR